MALFYGTSVADRIRRDFLAAGVITDPRGLAGTGMAGGPNHIYGYGGDDHIEAGDFGDPVYGGVGDDTIIGSAGRFERLRGEAGNDFNDAGPAGDAVDVVGGGPGADVTTGGNGQNLYGVDSYRDVVFDSGGGTGDTIVTNLNWVLPENPGIEGL